MTIWYEKLFLQNALYFLITEYIYIYTLTDNFNVYIILTLLIMFNKN